MEIVFGLVILSRTSITVASFSRKSKLNFLKNLMEIHSGFEVWNLIFARGNVNL